MPVMRILSVAVASVRHSPIGCQQSSIEQAPPVSPAQKNFAPSGGEAAPVRRLLQLEVMRRRSDELRLRWQWQELANVPARDIGTRLDIALAPQRISVVDLARIVSICGRVTFHLNDKLDAGYRIGRRANGPVRCRRRINDRLQLGLDCAIIRITDVSIR